MPAHRSPLRYVLGFVLCVGIYVSQAQTNLWKQTGGPPGGFVNALAINSEGHLFAGTESGIFRTTDEGAHWTWLNTRYNIRGAGAIAVNAQGHVFVATDLGLFRSINNGATWAFINGNLRDASFIGIAPNGYIFVGNYRSTDNGSTWARLNLPSVSLIDITSNRRGDLFIGAEGGVYHSLDQGESWRFVRVGAENLYVLSLAVDGSGNVLGGTTNGVYLSTDNGGTWQLTPLRNTRAITVAVNAQDHFYAATEGLGYDEVATYLFRSLDHGDSWVPCDSLLPKQAISALVFGSRDQIFAGLKGRGVFRSLDKGESWAATNLSNSEVYTVALNSQGHLFAGTRDGNGGVFRSSDSGESWEAMGLSDYEVRSFAFNTQGGIFAAALSFEGNEQEETGIYRSRDNGGTWTLTDIKGVWIGAIAIDSKDHIFAIEIGSNKILRSDDDGSVWTETILGVRSGNGLRVLMIDADDRVFAGGDFGIVRSSDHGENWIELTTALSDIRALASNSDDQIFVGTGRGVYHSTDGGGQWERRSEGLTNGFVISLAINSQDEIFAGTDGSLGPPGAAKVFRSNDNGMSWMSISDGAGQQQITSLVVNSRGYLFGGTIHGGVFRSEIPTTSVREPSEDRIKSFSLLQNYPNPFSVNRAFGNPATTIRYDLPKNARVKITIYNLLGEKVRTLVDAHEIAGFKQVSWDGLNDAGARVASGVYVYRLATPGYTAARKFLLIR